MAARKIMANENRALRAYRARSGSSASIIALRARRRVARQPQQRKRWRIGAAA